LYHQKSKLIKQEETAFWLLHIVKDLIATNLGFHANVNESDVADLISLLNLIMVSCTLDPQWSGVLFSYQLWPLYGTGKEALVLTCDAVTKFGLNGFLLCEMCHLLIKQTMTSSSTS